MASCCSLASDVPLGSLSGMVTSIMCHTAVNKLGLPAELSNMAQHGAVVPFPAFGPGVESAFDMVLLCSRCALNSTVVM